METRIEEARFAREMRCRHEQEGGTFWHKEGVLAVFDAETAQKVAAKNFAELNLPDKLADLLRGRKGDPVSWKSVRTGWATRMRDLQAPERVAELHAEMGRLLAERTGRPLDLPWAIQQICTRSLLPFVVAGLAERDRISVFRDQDYKLARLLTFEPEAPGVWKELRSIWIQVRAGSVVRRELKGRASGRRPRRPDLADPVVDRLEELGLDRAVDAVTGVLTAIAGPPGAVATCLVFELARRPEWRERIEGEMGSLAPGDLANPGAAPAAYRFVKETLRFWSAPLFLTRPVRTDIEVDGFCLKEGERYFVSPYRVHHDPKSWRGAEAFDPDRWLAGAENGGHAPASYVPFGWAPTSCIGAAFGTTQLLLLCHLLATSYRLEVREPEKVAMALGAIAYPKDFSGVFSLR
jgi:cytochrome P450